MGGGGGSHQSTQQTSAVSNTSTVDAQKHYAFNISQQGLSPGDAAALLQSINSRAATNDFISGISGAAGGGSSLVTLAVIIILAALIFGRR